MEKKDSKVEEFRRIMLDQIAYLKKQKYSSVGEIYKLINDLKTFTEGVKV